MTENKIKWILFLLVAVCLPVYLAAPMAGVFYEPIIMVALSSFDYGFNAFGAIVFSQFLVYGIVIYLFIKYLARYILKLKRTYAVAVLLFTSTGLIFITFLPLYGLNMGENLYELITRQLAYF